MTVATLSADAARGTSAASAAPGRRGELAIALQEAFTVGVRLRTKRQVAANAAAFRAHVKQLLTTADRQARSAGYDPDHVRSAIYAYIAFLDESVLNSQQPMFAEWPRQPLQEEVFGDHVAGENFFRNLADLLARHDADDIADVLEVYQLSILLGFRGKYAANPGALQAALSAVQDKIRRIRGTAASFSPAWALPERETVRAARDAWLPRLAIAAIGALILAVLLYVLFRLALGGDAGDLNELVSQLAR
ncbi:MAG: DotU family type IV/VI secretion system protein [Longimicrobiales bacterium]